MTMDSADLWFCLPTSHSVVSDDTGAFGTVCKPIGTDAEKSGSRSHPPGGGGCGLQHKTEGVL